MKSKKAFTKAELKNLKPEEIIKKIQTEDYSLLKTLGGENLRKQMVPVGKLCTLLVTLCPTPEKLAKCLQKFAPVKYNSKNLPKNSKNGLVIGFNHPSLGEIPRLILLKLEHYRDKKALFPVNLPWYEAIAPLYDCLIRLGIIITPTITPSTWKKLNLSENDPLYEDAKTIKRAFRDIYTNLSVENVKNGGCILVAPSATRQATVFKTRKVFEKEEEIIPTMSVLALQLFKDPKTECDFLPVAVRPLEEKKRGINLFKTYTLLPGKTMFSAEIKKTYFKEKNPKRLENFDYDFHMRLADELPKKYWF